MKRLSVSCIAALCVLCGALSAKAPTLELAAVTKDGTLDELRELCRLAGYVAEDVKDDAGDPGLLVKMGELKVALVLYGDKGRYPSFSCQSAFQLDKAPAWSKLNEWNKTHRYSRAYLNDAKAAVLESDLDLTGGSTWLSVANFLKTFESSVGEFAKHIGFG